MNNSNNTNGCDQDGGIQQQLLPHGISGSSLGALIMDGSNHSYSNIAGTPGSNNNSNNSSITMTT